jgi:alkylhydroperoxidase/carboxymuconolactone decarboxylase family protein YurZ
MTTSNDFDSVMQELADGGGPLMQAIAQMNAGMGSSPEFDERTLLLMRFAALVALDAPAQSYLVTLALGERSGITAQAVQAALAALAPVVGAPRALSAAGKVAQAIQMAQS